MANSRYKYFTNIHNLDTNQQQKGFSIQNLTDLFSGPDDRSYTIPLKYQYRPDLIALDFYNDAKLFWVLVYANNFRYSPDDFETGVVIKVPRYERVRALV